MSTRIKILPEKLTNKIAAGEVVERPASVVKELVENALDAGSSEVVVEIESGGRKLIRVTDDGSGMTREDALLSLERHATSKIATDSDLFQLTTLGFRGEALPSIASVSRFTLASRVEGSMEGTEIYAEGGRIKEVKTCGMARGTLVSVRNLFFNTPARLKFMKGIETETGHVGEFLTRLAISRPAIRFTYMSDGRTVFRVLNSDLRERITALLGNALAAELHPIDFDNDGISVTGLIAPPECSRSAPTHIYTYINGRFIRDRVVQHAILQSYRNVMQRGRYPLVFLFIGVAPDEVDVNVHPTKHEVRFREQGRVHDAIQNAISAVLRTTPWIRSSGNRDSVASIALPATAPAAQRTDSVRESLARYASQPPRQESIHIPKQQERTVSSGTPVVEAGPTGYFSGLSVLCQFNAAYILCQDGTDLVIIDQHAAHERVAFERLKSEFGLGRLESQRLLFPETVEFSFRETATVGEHSLEIGRLGYELEAFGGPTWLVNGVPRLLSGGEYLRTLRDILEELAGLGRSGSFADALEKILARIACHSVVRGSHSLTTREIEALLALMDATEFSSNCPHGRPVFQRIRLAELEKMFKRQ